VANSKHVNTAIQEQSVGHKGYYYIV